MFSLVLINNTNSQENINCMSKKLMVVAEDLNFREEPSTNSKVIGVLENSEFLELIKIQNSNVRGCCYNINNSWLKVLRIKTNQEGYVSGKYVKPQNIAYANNQECERIQSGNWYGLYEEKNKVYLTKIIPKLETVEYDKYIVTDSKNIKYIICSQEELSEGEIIGRFYSYEDDGYIKIGTRKRLQRIGNNQFEIVCTGEVELKGPTLFRKKEKIIIQRIEIDGSKRSYFGQDISNSILKYGEIGYSLRFAGDINNDGIIDVILSEADTHEGTLYYFLSNASGEIEIQSLTWSFSKC